ncbi:SapC family protein [Halomonas sp. ANAO-440]|uniref:SapC family protein n=1 Tax=Halomonas sp. ANAO-440 TaxID=2861360 RepID=UPI001CAA5A69|nr:SapC family protein [Halomonas sp. ANAO-440]MBZ0329354.1 SapC family protein [Halomonas sp. ANAO-440]
MPHYVPLQPSVHRHAGFQRAEDLYHAAHERFAPILVDELAQVLPYMPLCFLHLGDQGFQLVAVQGLEANRNLFVHPTTHKWLVSYTPACYRGYPFGLRKEEHTGKAVLCFDTSSGLMHEPIGPNDIPFFDEQGQPGQPLKDTLTFLKAVEEGQGRTQAAVDALAGHGLIETWPVTLQRDDEKKSLPGLYRIAAKALQELPAEALAELNALHALQLAHAQLFSQSQMKHLAKLQRLHAQFGDTPASDNLDELFGEGDDEFRFDFDS